ncbi:MAG: hypothetical protein LH472_06555 [Pyrinomonadaceae bacterium]|nr:hypothetical protein [Pyrinomonadaceae bacterium]
MKLKTLILLAVLFSISTTAFGQKEPVKTPGVPNKPANVTKLEITPSAAKTPTVQKILAKYVQAIGGKATNEKIKSRIMKGTVELAPMGVKGTFEGFAAAPNKSVTTMSLTGIGEIIEGFDGSTAWSVNPISGNRVKQGEELAQTKIIYNFYREINLDKLYQKMELKGVEKVGANDAYVVVGTPDNLPPETFYFDTENGLLLRQDMTLTSPEVKTPTKTFFEDFRDVDGVKLPFKTRTTLPQFEVITIFTEIKHNAAVEAAKFAKPKE